MNYPSSVHTSKMDKLKSMDSVFNVANYNADKTRLNRFDKAYKELDRIEKEGKFNESDDKIKKYLEDLKDLPKIFDKDTNEKLITSLNFDNVDNTYKEFKEVEELYHSHKKESGMGTYTYLDKKTKATITVKKTPNQAFCLFINFNGTDIPAKKVHAISTEIAKRICGDEYKALIATHTNTEHYHSHILINAYNNDGMHKLKEELRIGKKWQAISNDVALENGCDILLEIDNGKDDEEKIDNVEFPKVKFKSLNEYQLHKKGKLGKLMLQNDIITILQKESLKDIADFKEKMTNKGWTLIENENDVPMYFKEGFMGKDKNGNPLSYIRETRLDRRFRLENIERFIKIKNSVNIIVKDIKPIKFSDLTPKYTRDKFINNRVPIVLLFIIVIINLIIRLIKDTSNLIEINEKNKDILNDNIYRLKAEQKYIENVKKWLEEYNKMHEKDGEKIDSLEDIKVIKNKLIRYEYRRELVKGAKAKEKIIKKLEEAITLISENKEKIEKNNLYMLFENDLYDKSLARINKAQLYPMTSIQKGKLFDLIRNSGFGLKYRFNELNFEEANLLIEFFENTKKGINTERPKDLIISVDEYKNVKNDKKPIENEVKKYKKLYISKKVKDISEAKCIEINKAVKLLERYGYKFGNEKKNVFNELKAFENDIKKIKGFYEEKEDKYENARKKLKKLNDLEAFYDGSYKDKFISMAQLAEKSNLESIEECFKSEYDNTSERIIALKKLLYEYINIPILENKNLILPPAEFKLALKLMSELSDNPNKLTEKDIINMPIEEIKETIEVFMKKYPKSKLDEMARKYYLEEIGEDPKEAKKIKDIVENESKKEEKMIKINYKENSKFI